MPTAQERLKGLLAAHVAPVMKRHGYRRERNRWGKRVELGGRGGRRMPRGGSAEGNGWFVYEVQVSQWSNRRTLSFTVNVGIYSDVLAAFGLWQRPKDRVPAAMYCCYQQRIGRLMPSKLDEWWDVHSRRDAAPVGEAVARLTERRVIPHLEKKRLYADLLKTFERPPAGFRPMWREHAALILLERGVRACRRWVAESEVEEVKREWLERAGRLGVIGRSGRR